MTDATENSESPDITKRISFLIIFPFLSAGVTIGMLRIVSLSGKYPFVFRSDRAYYTPNPLMIISLIFSVVITCLIFSLLRKYIFTKFQWRFNNIALFGFSIYFFFLISGLIGNIINGRADFSEPETFRTTVINKRIPRASKNKRFYVYVRDWRNLSNEVRFDVKRHEYDTMPIGTPLRVVTKSGALGYEWIVSRSIETK